MRAVREIRKQMNVRGKGARMKVFLVITERDGEITKKLGETTTKIIKTERRYAAETIELVWETIHEKPEFFGTDEELTCVYEEHSSITVL